MPNKHDTENGQAIVLIVLAMISLLGITALAIDGGMAYSDRRQVQNAADAAALAGGLQKANGRTETNVRQAAWNTAGENGFDNSQVTTTISGPFSDLFGQYYLVYVTIVSPVETAFLQFISGGSLQNTVEARARAYPSQPALPGYALLAMGDCTTEGGHQISITGGGNSGGVETFQGGMFINVPEGSGNHCAVDPPNQGVGIIAHDGRHLSSVGSHAYSGESNISPLPVINDLNGGSRIEDPLFDLAEPVCTGNGSEVGGVFQPGRYGGSGQPDIDGGTYAPGIYCISGDVHLSGNEVIEGDGVVLYMINGGLNFSGNAGMRITAPTSINCLGTAGSPSSSCTYAGIAVFMARSNTSTFEVRGNGGDAIHGMVYALNGTIQASGGGSDPNDTTVYGQVIARRIYGNGNGSFQVTYNENETYHKAPVLAVEK